MSAHGPLSKGKELKQGWALRNRGAVRRATNKLSSPTFRESANAPAPKSYKGYAIKTIAQVVAEEKALRKSYGPYQR